MASWSLGKALRSLWQKETLDESTWEELDDALLLADAGPDATDELMSGTRAEAERIGLTKPSEVKDLLAERIEAMLAQYDPTLRLTERPAVVLVVGVNGVGKTTTIGKFARFLTKAGRSVVIAAADTFRAAAVDQLAHWAERAGVDIVRPDTDGQDPASVAYQAVAKAQAEGIDIVLIDTAGRLHTKTGLMDELEKNPSGDRKTPTGLRSVVGARRDHRAKRCHPSRGVFGTSRCHRLGADQARWLRPGWFCVGRATIHGSAGEVDWRR